MLVNYVDLIIANIKPRQSDKKVTSMPDAKLTNF